MIQTLGRLQSVPLREVWAHEANDFTPWLAQPENIALLAVTLQLDELQVQGTEIAVGSFYIDILARDVEGNVVLIENQFGPTDHSHLGQIMTYIAGQEGNATIIWIAERFREEHRAAIDWLNASTIEGFNFFAVEVEALKIANSVPAPWFNVVGKPNAWSRDVVRATSSAGDSYANWLLPSIAEKLQGIGEAQGWPLQYKLGKQAVTFRSAEWPLHLGDCQFRVDLYRAGNVATRFSFRSAKAPGFKELLEARRSEWEPNFPARIERPAYETPFVTLTLDRPCPEVGDHQKLAALVDGVVGMTAALRPMVDEQLAATVGLKSEAAPTGQSGAGVPQSEALKGMEAGVGIRSDGDLNVVGLDPTVPGADPSTPPI